LDFGPFVLRFEEMQENRVLYQNGVITLGEFRCLPENPRWRDLNVNGDEPVAAFPGTSVVIQHAGRDAVLANPNHVMFYGPGTRYRRVLHDARGDRCLFVNLRPELVNGLLAAAGVTSTAGEAPFTHGPSDPTAYLRLRLAATRISAGTADPLEVEEAVHGAISLAVERGALVHISRRRPPRERTESDHHRLIEDAKALLTERATQHDSLEALARLLHTSAFHLGRVFRDRTGFSVHAYRTHLRLRLALDRLADRDVELATIALELGFNSHSHFTGAFRSVFSLAPSEVRSALDGKLLRQLRKTVEAPSRRPS
jgi:AraC-like DNA-binding protein